MSLLSLLHTRPAGAGGAGVSDHALLSHLAYADAGHTGFCSLATPQTITAEKIIDSAVGLRFGHAAGPLLQGPAAGALLSLSGDLSVSGYAGLAGCTPYTGAYLRISPAGVTWTTSMYLLEMNPSSCSVGVGGTLFGLQASANPNVLAGATPTIRGLSFLGFPTGPGNPPEVTGARIQVGCAFFSGTITDLVNVWAYPATILFSGAGAITRSYGIRIGNQGKAGVGDTWGLLIEPQSGSTNCYSIWAGALRTGTPRLRLDEGTPGANQTMLYLAEGVTPTLGRVQWKLFSDLIAGDRVMVLV